MRTKLLYLNLEGVFTFAAFWSDFNEVPIRVNVAKVLWSMLIKVFLAALLDTCLHSEVILARKQADILMADVSTSALGRFEQLHGAYWISICLKELLGRVPFLGLGRV